MRLLTLYIRSRSIPASLGAALAATSGLWLLSHAIHSPRATTTLALLAAAAGTAAIAPGLAGRAADLDRTAAIAWPPRRAAHIIVASAAIAGLLAATALTGDPIADVRSVARNVIGLGGLVALGAASLGVSRAWLPSATWTLYALLSTPPFGTPAAAPMFRAILTWMIQPPATTIATVTAIALGTGGTLAYALVGPRR